MKKGLYFVLSVCLILMLAGVTGASASTLPSKLAAPKNVVVSYGYTGGSQLRVTYPNSAEMQKIIGMEGVEAYAQVDWKFSKNDDWKYVPAWDEGKTSNPDSNPYWEKIWEWVSDYQDYSTADLFDFDGTEYEAWTDNERGWSKVVPAKYMMTYEIMEDKYETIDWDNVGVDVRVRYYARQENWNDALSEYEYTYLLSDWSDTVSYGNYSKDYEGIGNLLENPDFEQGLKGWKNPDKCWFAVIESDVGNAQHGRVLVWPVKSASLIDGYAEGESTRIYQDVDISKYKADETLVFKTLICNYDQMPRDMGKVVLSFYDKDGKAVKNEKGKAITYSQSQRNPNWNAQTIICSIPEGAAKVRVNLYACRYAGSDIDAYYDYCSLTVKPEKVYPVKVTEKKNTATAKTGDKIQLYASNSKSTKASDFTWSSSFNEAATVDANGLVTFGDDAERGVSIFAADKKTGVVGVYSFNISDAENDVYDANDGGSAADEKPAGTKISKITKGSKALTVKWTKAKGVTGYEIMYSTAKNMKDAQTVEIKKAATVKKKLTGLKGGKKYYVKIRTYKVVNGKKVYSDWSTVKTAKTKK